MSKTSNANAIYRYGRTCNKSIFVKKNSACNGSSYNTFKLFTNNLSYYKTRISKYNFDTANEPYKITSDKSGRQWFNVYDDKDGFKVLPLNDREQKQLFAIVNRACDKLYEDGKQITVKAVKTLLASVCEFNFNTVSIADIVSNYKSTHDIKRNDGHHDGVTVWRNNVPKISKGAVKLSRVVGQ